MPAKPLLAYYQDCYKEDCVDLNLWHLGKLNQEDRLFIEGEDSLLSGFLPRQPIAHEAGAQLLPRIAMYQRERQLLYVSHFVVGQLKEEAQTRTVLSPLVFKEAQLEEDDGSFYVSLKEGALQINEPLLRLLLPEDSMEAGFDAIFAPERPDSWTSLLSQSHQNIDTLGLLGFPKLTGYDSLARLTRKRKLTLVPASALVFLKRPSASRGILHEISAMMNAAELSAPLQNLMGTQLPPKAEAKRRLKSQYLPCLLSRAQQQVLEIGAGHSLGCVVGPPGTGKSYTIAAVATEHMARGESVLIVANNEHALDVINDKLESQFGLKDISLRAGQKAFLKQLKDYLSNLLDGYHSLEHTPPRQLESQLNLLNRQLDNSERRLLRFLRRAIRRGQRLHKLERSQRRWLLQLYLALFGHSMENLSQHWDTLDELNDSLTTKEALAAKLLQNVKASRVAGLLNNHRQQLQTFNQAIRSRTSQRQFALFDTLDYQVLQQAFPIWLVSLNTLHKVLPLQRELFDLVIFDEASQSNITSALPALFRAKRALVVGDGKQLRHISFLSRSKEQALQQLHGVSTAQSGICSYRDKSILDLVAEQIASQQQVAFLDEHFRSAPELISFSNSQFYQQRLRIMQHRPCTSSGHLHLHSVMGERSEQGVNQAEISALCNLIRQQIDSCEQAGMTKSLGVLSPFRAQADALADALFKQFSATELEKYRLRADTPFGFQGEERDIMYLSFAVDPQSKRAAVYLNREDVFNVAITRAREQQHLFVSVAAQELPSNSLLRRYLESSRQFNARHRQNDQLDQFQRQLCDALAGHNIETWPGYEIAGTEVDILCRWQGEYLALDLIGFPGPWMDFFELDTYKILQRAKVPMLPISYGLWLKNPGACIERIRSKLGQVRTLSGAET